MKSFEAAIPRPSAILTIQIINSSYREFVCMNLKCQFIRILLKERNIQQVCHQGSVVFLLKRKHKYSYIWKVRAFFIVVVVIIIIIIISFWQNKNFWYFPFWGKMDFGGMVMTERCPWIYITLHTFIIILNCPHAAFSQMLLAFRVKQEGECG